MNYQLSQVSDGGLQVSQLSFGLEQSGRISLHLVAHLIQSFLQLVL
jgi:hypothetical protein